MRRLALLTNNHPKAVVALWLVGAGLLFGLGHSLGSRYSDNLALAGSQSEQAADLLERSFPAQRGERIELVFARQKAAHRHAQPLRGDLQQLARTVEALPGIAAVESPTLANSGRAATVGVLFKAEQPPKPLVRRVVAAAASAASHAHLSFGASGRAVEALEGSSVDAATAIGLLAAIVVLLITFGSPLAAALPVLCALTALAATLGLIALDSRVLEMPSFASELAAMVGLGVGIDYALFILSRYREGLAVGLDPAAALLEAVRGGGSAVLFAGLTVVISLLGMELLGVGVLAGAALASAIAVTVMVCAALTLLPALIALCGQRLRATPLSLQRLIGGRLRGWERWGRLLARRSPWFAAVAVVGMVALIVPAGSIQLGFADGGEGRPGSLSYRAYHTVAREFGPGANGPIEVVARSSAADYQPAAVLALLRGALLRGGGVAAVSPLRVAARGAVATFQIQPRFGPHSPRTEALIERLRRLLIPAVQAAAPLQIAVGGMTASALDFSTALEGSLPLFICLVSGLAALLLLLVFRSPLIALKASLVNLLAIGASLGIVVMVFQWGLLGPLSPFGRGPIESFLPVMVFAIVYGLSMDYEVFLIARIHERHRAGSNPSRATTEGLALSGPVITAAAAIMVCVFCSFIAGGERVIAEFGLALASAVFLDATLIRCLLIPALLCLFGERTWHAPRLLRALPPLIAHPRLGEGSAGVGG